MADYRINVWRQDQLQQQGHFEQYLVENISADMSFLEMLDVLNEKLISDDLIPVAFDHDCREGICGACSLVINGIPHGKECGTTTCQLYMRHFKAESEITIEPFRAKAFPLIKDLIVDRSSLDRVLQSGGYVSVNTGAAADANNVLIAKHTADDAFTAATCIGCGACGVACQDDAIGYSHKQIEIESILSECINEGVENIELHASVIDDEPVLHEWSIVNKINTEGFNSVCIDRGYLSNHALKIRIEKMLDLCDDRMIVQADGIPMSGGIDDFRTTLQAVACADIVDKFSLPVHILLSGGTNSQSIKLSQNCDVPFAGVSIGTYARHLVYEYINDQNFPEREILNLAVNKAKSLVDTCLNE